MRLRKGSNQFIWRKHGLKPEVERDVWFLSFLITIGLIVIVKMQPSILSPCPVTGCTPSKVEAAELAKSAQLAEENAHLKTVLDAQKTPEAKNIVAYIASTFAPEGTAIIVKAINCFYSESGLRTEAYNFNTNGTEDRGVAQINSIHHMKPEDAHDYRKNIDKAYQIYKSRKGFSAWYGPGCK